MCVAAVVAAPETPGCTILAPAEKPAMWWGTTAPVPITISAPKQVLVHLDRRSAGRHPQIAQRRRAVVVLRDAHPREHLVPNLVSDLGVSHRTEGGLR